MRLVLDTNTVVSGLLWGGFPRRLIEAGRSGQVSLASSTRLMAELQDVLVRQKFKKQLVRRGVAAVDLWGGYETLLVIVTPAAIPPTVLRDPDDDAVLATAVAAKADMIVSGDAHLLDLVHFQSIAIVSAADAVARLP